MCQYPGDRGERQDIVDHRRLAEQAFMRWQRWFGANLSALALKTV